MKILLSQKSIRIFIACWFAYTLLFTVGAYYLFKKIVSYIPESEGHPFAPMRAFVEVLPGICQIGFVSNICILLYAFLIVHLLITYKHLKPLPDLFFKTFAFLYVGQAAGSAIISSLSKRELTDMIARNNNPLVVFEWMSMHIIEMLWYGNAGWLIVGILVFFFYKEKQSVSEEVI